MNYKHKYLTIEEAAKELGIGDKELMWDLIGVDFHLADTTFS
jgi:hypothetical protein